MKKHLIVLTVILWVAIVPLALAAEHQETKPKPETSAEETVHSAKPEMSHNMMCPMMANAQKGQAMMLGDSYSPLALLARANELGLTYDQVQKLKELDKEISKKARGVLKPDQISKINAAPFGPEGKMSSPMMKMMEMKMKGKMDEKDKNSEDMKSGGKPSSMDKM
ncbi:MAG: hypothetical protein WC647_00615 [Desulfomonilaceae bacterium]|jgi:hypothetical protein